MVGGTGSGGVSNDGGAENARGSDTNLMQDEHQWNLFLGGGGGEPAAPPRESPHKGGKTKKNSLKLYYL